MISFAYHKHFATAFDTGERRFAQTYLLYASSGTFHLELDDRCWLLPPHRAALIQADTPIRIWTNAPSTSASVLFAPDCIEVPSLQCQVFRVTALITEMTHYATRWNEAEAELDSQSQSFFIALAHVVAGASQEVEQLWFPRAKSPELIKAVDFTLAHLGEALHFSEVAQHALASERTLSRRFTDELGMAWSEFVQRARLIKATERLVMSDDQVGLIAHDSGFASASSFGQTFRQVMGETPTRYRQRLKLAAV